MKIMYEKNWRIHSNTLIGNEYYENNTDFSQKYDILKILPEKFSFQINITRIQNLKL